MENSDKSENDRVAPFDSIFLYLNFPSIIYCVHNKGRFDPTTRMRQLIEVFHIHIFRMISFYLTPLILSTQSMAFVYSMTY